MPKRLAVHTLHLDEQVPWSRPAATRTHMLTASKAGDGHLAALKQVVMLVQQQALTLTYNDVLMLMAGCFFLALPLTLLLARPTSTAMEAH